MPSENPVQKLGFLKAQLRDGALPFRYRVGVRALLGLPEAKEDLPRFAQSLPPAGFRYREMLQEKAPEVNAPTWRENWDQASRNEANQERSGQEGQLPDAPFKPAPVLNQDSPPHQFQTEPSKAVIIEPEPNRLPKQQTRESAAQSHSKPFDLSEKSIPTSSEETQVAIPGYSKGPRVFPALKPEKQEDLNLKTEPVSSATPATSTTNNTAKKPPLRAAPIPRADLKQKPDEASFQSARAAEISEKMPVHGPAIQPKLREDAPPKVVGQTLQSPQSRLSTRSSIAEAPPQAASSVSPDAPSSAASRPARQDPATQIQQLRQAVRTLKNKNTVLEKNQHAEGAGETHQAVQAPEPQAAPVVIVKQAPPQSKTPPAFWERRYLSHAALRLRVLR